jgi:cation diffusion facilitator family transporter
MAPDGARKFALLSVAAALATIALKTLAWWITDSVGLLSDALEGSVNLVGATVALTMLTIAARPPDDAHAYGYSKAEYFASGFEGVLILVAAVAIAYAAVDRLIAPRPIGNVGVGLVISAVASVVNYVVAQRLFEAGRHYRSIALEADARHLMTDVWTSLGVVVGVAAAAATGWQPLDPLIALAVALNIVWTGIQLMRRSAQGLLDHALPPEQLTRLEGVLDSFRARGIDFHAMRTRQAGARAFVSLHVLVPADWSVKRGHDLAHEVEHAIRAALPEANVLTHIEPIGDPASYRDVELDPGSEKRDS